MSVPRYALIVFLAAATAGCEPPPAANKSAPGQAGAGAPNVASQAAPAPAGDPQAAIMAAFRQASERSDMDQMLKLYCWDGVDNEMRETVRGNVQDELEQPVTDLEFVPVEPGKIGPTVEDGIRWKPNLPVVAMLRARYTKPRPGTQLTLSEANHTLGLQGGQYRLTVPVREQ